MILRDSVCANTLNVGLGSIAHIFVQRIPFGQKGMLDTFPYSGTTTTCNALYNSIPVITLYNKDIHSHNVSSSILIRCGFPELVAQTFQEYVDKTTTLIKNTAQIDVYKATIGRAFNKYMNASQFMRSYEETLVGLYNERLPP